MRRVTGSSPVSSTKYVPQRDIAKRSFCELPLMVHNAKVINTVKNKFSVAGRRIVWPEDLDTGATHAFSLICLSPSFLLPTCSPTANRVVASSLGQQRYLFCFDFAITLVSVLCSTGRHRGLHVQRESGCDGLSEP